MISIKKNFKTFAVVMIFTIIISACGAAAPAEPTADPNAVFTQVAQTVMVSMTQTAEALPPTPMPQPTATTAPTPTIGIPPTQAVVSPTLPVGPTATIQRFGDSAQYNTQTPLDGKVFNKGEEFQFIVCFGNNGSTIWDHTYYLEWISGFRLWSDTKYFYIGQGEQIEPGGKWCFYSPAVAPHNSGTYMTRWYMKNGENQYMQEVYFNYSVD